MQKQNGTVVNIVHHTLHRFLWGGLFVVVPIGIRKAPEHGFIAKLLHTLQHITRKFALRRAKITRHAFPRQRLKSFFQRFDLLLDALWRCMGKVRVVGGMVADKMTFLDHARDQTGLRFDEML